MNVMGDKKIPYDKLRGLKGPNSHESTPLLPSSWAQPPKDIFLFTYFIFFLHGVGHLLPWNFFITAHSYFEESFTHLHPKNGSKGFGDSFENYFSVAAMVPNALMTLVNVWLQTKVQYKYRLVGSLIVMVALFALTLAFVAVPRKQWIDGFFGVTLVTVIVLSTASAVFQSSTFGFAGLFPSKYTSIVLSGQAVAGVFAAVVQIVSLGAASGDSTLSAYGYFSTALFIVIICLVSFFAMSPLKFVRYHMEQTSFKNIKAKQEAVVRASVNVKTVDTSVPFFKIFASIWLYAVSVFLVFAVTLSLFPSVLSNVVSVSPNRAYSGWTSTYFSTLICFLLFNCSDFTGRFVTHWVSIGNNRFVLFISSVLRVLFVPLILLCNIRVGGDRTWPIVFHSDAYPAVFTTLMGLTNGYFGSTAMITAPQSLPPDQRETGSTIMAFFLTAGLLCGSCFSFMWTHLLVY